MADMTPADVMALNRDSNFLEGNGIIILILFFLMLGGNGLFGGNAAAQGALTRAEMQDSFNSAEIQRNQSDIRSDIAGVGREIMDNRYTNQLGFCDLKTAIHAEGEATRALIQQQTIDDLKYQLTQAQTAVANAVQTNNILNSLGRFVMNPSVNPYTCYNGCGCV